MLNDFIQYLKEQIGQPYLWGGQHTKLTTDNYVSIIHKREDGRGKYADGTTYADAAIAYCKKMFDKGYTVLYAYDCSGLGMYWIQNLRHIWTDKTADGMMRNCSDLTNAEPPEKGWWVFRQNSRGVATHIGYMIDDTYLIEAKGRKFGVVKTKWRDKDWSIWGIPSIFRDEIINPPTPPDPPEPPTPEPKRYVEVVGGTVRVRASDSVFGKKLFTAKRGDTFPFIGVAPSGWYQIETEYPESYITNKSRYTRLIDK